jgi:hypothetical protein
MAHGRQRTIAGSFLCLWVAVAGCAFTPQAGDPPRTVSAPTSTASILLVPQAPVDLTVPRQLARRPTAVMVLPPRGSERGQVSESADVERVERVLLRGGFRVISSAVTAKVVRDPTGNLVERASTLSDLERALVLAKESNAEVLLQIVEIDLKDRYRPFVPGSREGRFQEIRPGAQVDQGTQVVRVHEKVFSLRARAINVENGEIVMSVDVSQGTSYALPEPKTVAIVEQSLFERVGTKEVTTDEPERLQKAIEQVLDAFLSRLGPSAAPAQ